MLYYLRVANWNQVGACKQRYHCSCNRKVYKNAVAPNEWKQWSTHASQYAIFHVSRLLVAFATMFFFTPSGADVLGTVKCPPTIPITYEQRLAQINSRQLIDTQGFNSLFLKKLTVRGK